MQRRALSFPELAIIGGTRAAFGAGVALLAAGKLSDEQRRAVGWTLVAIGAITTVPIFMQLAGSANHPQATLIGNSTGAPLEHVT